MACWFISPADGLLPMIDLLPLFLIYEFIKIMNR